MALYGWIKIALGAVCIMQVSCGSGSSSSEQSRDSAPQMQPSCNDAIQNQNEIDVDCGGECSACTNGSQCQESDDCQSGVCLEGACVAYASSCATQFNQEQNQSGTYTIDPDGVGNSEPYDVYCNMDIASGSWQLISYIPLEGIRNNGNRVPIFSAENFCASLDECAGHLPPAEVSTQIQILIHDVTHNHWLIYERFSANNRSALRYMSGERGLTLADQCGEPNVCGSRSIDRDLRIVMTSGFPAMNNQPFYQYWQVGGWWVGASPNSGITSGMMTQVGFPFDGSTNRINQRNSSGANATLLSRGEHALYFRKASEVLTP